MNPMRIITVHQPWAWALATGEKRVENRPRNIAGSYRGQVAIHAGKQLDEVGMQTVMQLTGVRSMPIVHGAILGVVTLVGVHHADDCETGGGWCSPWADPESFHLVFDDPRSLTSPIEFRGSQGMRKLSDEDARLVRRALGVFGGA